MRPLAVSPRRHRLWLSSTVILVSTEEGQIRSFHMIKLLSNFYDGPSYQITAGDSGDVQRAFTCLVWFSLQNDKAIMLIPV